MSTRARKNVHFSANVLRFLQGADDSLSGRVNTIVDRYCEALRRATPIEGHFTETEKKRLLAVADRLVVDPAAHLFGGLALDLRDAGEDKLADKISEMEPFELVLLAEWLESHA